MRKGMVLTAIAVVILILFTGFIYIASGRDVDTFVCNFSSTDCLFGGCSVRSHPCSFHKACFSTKSYAAAKKFCDEMMSDMLEGYKEKKERQSNINQNASLTGTRYEDAGIRCFSDADCDGYCLYNPQNMNSERLAFGGYCQTVPSDDVNCTFEQAEKIVAEQEQAYAAYQAGGEVGPIPIRNPLAEPCAVPGTGYAE